MCTRLVSCDEAAGCVCDGLEDGGRDDGAEQRGQENVCVAACRLGWVGEKSYAVAEMGRRGCSKNAGLMRNCEFGER